MTHPDSDGIAEMFEGAHRAALTGAQRWLETVNRRRQDQAQIAQRLAEKMTQADLAHQQIIAGYQQRAAGRGDQPAGSINLDGRDVDEIRNDGLRLATPEQQQRAMFQELQESQSVGLERDLVAAADRQADILGQWTLDRAQLARTTSVPDATLDEAYWRRWAMMEATDQQLAAAHEQAIREVSARHTNPNTEVGYREYLDRRLAHLQVDVVDTARTAHQQALAQQKASAEAARILAAPLEAGPTTGQAEVAALQTRSRHDSHEFRVARAEMLGSRDYEPDVAQAAMINDLTFGAAAPEATTAPVPAKRPTKVARTANRGTIRERSGTGR